MRGQMPSGRVMLRVKPGWVGQCGGGVFALLPKVYSKPCRDGSLSRVQGCAHRSESDLGAAGLLVRRMVQMPGHGCDALGPAAGPCLCRRPWMRLRGGCWTRPPSPSRRKSVQKGLQVQVLGTTMEGL